LPEALVLSDLEEPGASDGRIRKVLFKDPDGHVVGLLGPVAKSAQLEKR